MLGELLLRAIRILILVEFVPMSPQRQKLPKWGLL